MLFVKSLIFYLVCTSQCFNGIQDSNLSSPIVTTELSTHTQKKKKIIIIIIIRCFSLFCMFIILLLLLVILVCNNVKTIVFNG